MQPGWRILLYHDVSWEQSAYLRAIGGTCPPDLFAEHVAAVAELGEIRSVPEALARFESGPLERSLFSFWFDDGFLGVREHAAPILRRFGVTGATSICSRFIARQEMFWRLKLSFLISGDGRDRLQDLLSALGWQAEQSIRDFTLDHFSPSLVQQIDEIYWEFTTPQERADAFRLFDTAEGLRELAAAGWTIANHTAAHLPVAEESALPFFPVQFGECEDYLERQFQWRSKFWVAPFDRPGRRAAGLFETFRAYGADRVLVLVGDQVNCFGKNPPATLFRYMVPIVSTSQMVRQLERLG